jgi:hypothetical protein
MRYLTGRRLISSSRMVLSSVPSAPVLRAGLLIERLLLNDLLADAALRQHLAGAQRQPIGDAIEPADQVGAVADGRGFLGQSEKRGLEDILGRVRVDDDALGKTQNHGPMPPDEEFEGGLIPVPDETVQELGVADDARRRAPPMPAQIMHQ